jgi:hypothetical protein
MLPVAASAAGAAGGPVSAGSTTMSQAAAIGYAAGFTAVAGTAMAVLVSTQKQNKLQGPPNTNNGPVASKK